MSVEGQFDRPRHAATDNPAKLCVKTAWTEMSEATCTVPSHTAAAPARLTQALHPTDGGDADRHGEDGDPVRPALCVLVANQGSEPNNAAIPHLTTSLHNSAVNNVDMFQSSKGKKRYDELLT